MDHIVPPSPPPPAAPPDTVSLRGARKWPVSKTESLGRSRHDVVNEISHGPLALTHRPTLLVSLRPCCLSGCLPVCLSAVEDELGGQPGFILVRRAVFKVCIVLHYGGDFANGLNNKQEGRQVLFFFISGLHKCFSVNVLLLSY